MASADKASQFAIEFLSKDSKTAYSVPAKIQGLAANVKRIRNSSIMCHPDQSYKPVFFSNKGEILDPEIVAERVDSRLLSWNSTQSNVLVLEDLLAKTSSE